MARKKSSIVQEKKNTEKKVVKKKVEKDDLEGSTSKTKIRIIGIGGGGSSVIAEIAPDLKRVDFVAANTDKRALRMLSKKTKTFQFGDKLTGGFGTGMDFELGKEAASSEKDRIKQLLEGQDICIFVSCLGGGTGSGAVPVFAKIARELGNITYGIFTLPFNFEGSRKMGLALEALREAKPHLNAMSILPNENIFRITDKNTPLKEALSVINNNLSDSLKGLMETIYNPGLINIDFADLKTVLEERGKLAYLNSLVFDGSKGIDEAIKKAISNPFYSYNIDGASGVLFNISGSGNLGLEDVSKISEGIAGLVKKNAKVMFGISQDQKYGDKIKVSLLAVGCDSEDIFPKDEKSFVKLKQIKEVKTKEEAPKKKKKASLPKKKIENNKKEAEVNIKIRKNGIQVKQAEGDVEKEILDNEKKWETPAFLRRKPSEDNKL